jgi:hypothetical protein
VKSIPVFPLYPLSIEYRAGFYCVPGWVNPGMPLYHSIKWATRGNAIEEYSVITLPTFPHTIYLLCSICDESL